MTTLLKKLGGVLGVLFALFIIFFVWTWYGFTKERQDVNFGVTFSTVMARQLGLEPRAVFDAIVDDLGARKIRLPVYWSDIEPEEGKFEFENYDYFIEKAEGAGVKLILAIGRKLPRWPECFVPGWAAGEESIGEVGLPGGSPTSDSLVLLYIRAIAERYKNSPAVEAWQVENEPFFAFGKECAGEALNSQELEEEVETVRQLSSKSIIVSDSGEQGFWVGAAQRGDILGITIYRQSWNDFLGVSRFPFGPGFYRLKSWLLTGKPVWVVELQAEPWGKELLPLDPLDFQKELMDAEQLKNNISYARRTGFDTFYLWGAEWWFWLKEKQNDSSLWEEARRVF